MWPRQFLQSGRLRSFGVKSLPGARTSSCLKANHCLFRRNPTFPISINPPRSRRDFTTTATVMGYRNGRNTTEVEDIRYNMEQVGQTKWGYVIYRCTYDDDEAWKKFIEFLKDYTHNELQEADALDLAEKLDWKVEADPQALDGASTDQVRDFFREWVKSNEARAEQTAPIYNPITLRQVFCVHVDAAALTSFVNRKIINQKADIWEYGYVNLVDGSWGALPDDPEHPKDEDGDVGYMRVAIDSLLPSSYAYFEGRGGWYAAYEPPPYVWG